MNEIITTRDIETVTAEIVVIKKNLQMQLLSGAVEIGRRLTEAKAMVPHGQWGKYLEERVEFSQSTAHNMMRLYEEYGQKDQASLFGVNSQALDSLSVTAAIRLLSLPEGQREAFIEEHDVAGMSTRELEAAIREANEEKTRAQEAEAITKGILSAAEKKLDTEKAKVKDLEEKLKKAQEAAQNAKAETAAKEREHRDAMAQIRQEAEEKAKQEAVLEVKKELETARQAAAEAERKLADITKNRMLSNPAAVEFKLMFKAVQEDFNKMMDCIREVAKTEPELAEKLVTGCKAIMKNMQEVLG